MSAALAALALLAIQPAPDLDGPGQTPTPGVGALPDPPPISEDARQAAVRAAYDAAQARRGPLDGRWRLSAADGHVLYLFQLSDPGPVPDPRSISPGVPVIEGAWRDPNRPGAADGSGFLDSVQRADGVLTVRFLGPDRSGPVVLTLHPRAAGDWAGVIAGPGPAQPVVMRRF